MSKTTRRAILAGTAALPLAIVPVCAALGSFYAALLALEPAFTAAHRAMKEQSAIINVFHEMVEKTREPWVPGPDDEDLPPETQELFNKITLGEYRRMPLDHPLRVQMDAHHERMKARRAEWHARMAARWEARGTKRRTGVSSS
jgi:hypothetical protein